MATKLTQALVNRATEEHSPGTQLYDEEVSGLRVVVGKKGCSYKLVGRINDGSARYVSIIIGRVDDVSLRTARERAVELRLALRRGDDPRKPKAAVPSLNEALERYLDGRKDLSPKTALWYRQKVNGPLKPLAKLPVDRIDRETARAMHEKLSRKIGPCGANGAMRVLKLLLNDVARTHDLPPNPVSRAVRMNKEHPRDWAVPPAEMPLLWERLDAMQDRVRRACWMTLLLTGLRSTDARTMKWEHLDKDGVLTVPSPKGGKAKAFKLPLADLLLDEPPRQLLGQCTDGAIVPQLQERMDAGDRLLVGAGGFEGYQRLSDGALQPTATPSVQRRHIARPSRRNSQFTVRN